MLPRLRVALLGAVSILALLVSVAVAKENVHQDGSTSLLSSAPAIEEAIQVREIVAILG